MPSRYCRRQIGRRRLFLDLHSGGVSIGKRDERPPASPVYLPTRQRRQTAVRLDATGNTDAHRDAEGKLCLLYVKADISLACKYHAHRLRY